MRTAFWVVLAAIALTMLYAWIGLIWAPPVPVRLWPGAATLAVPQWLVPIGGLALAAAALVYFADRDWLPFDLGGPLFAPLAIAVAILVWLGVERGVIEPLRGGLLLLLALLTAASTLTVLAMLRSGGPIGVRSYFGGLGNGMGGWQVLPTTVAFLLTLAFLGATVLVAIDRGGPTAAKSAAPSPGATAAAPTPAAKAATPPAAAKPAAAPPAGATAPQAKPPGR